MTGILIAVLAFIVALGVLITFHEFGHFWVARRLGVKVLRFSVGFGKPLWRYQPDPQGTEYVISALPLGGYVKMLDEREVDVPADEQRYAFNRKSVAARFAIVAAGPVFNFVLAAVVYWLIFMLGTTSLKPVIGDVAQESIAAQAGLRGGDEIVAVGGERTASWDEVRTALLDAVIEGDALEVRVRRQNGTLATQRLDLRAKKSLLEKGAVLRNMGVEPWSPPVPPVIDRVVEGSPAAMAGLQPGDRFVSLDGKRVETWAEVVDYVVPRPGEAITVVVERDGQRETLSLRPEHREQGGQAQGYMGVAASRPQLDDEAYEGMRVEVRHGPLASVGKSVATTGQNTVLILRMLGEMVLGNVSLDNISGPITIAQYAGITAMLGVTAFLSFIAIVSLSLGVLNLLPIPVLDGGHLMYYIIEMVKGSPVSEHAQAVGQQIGIVLILLLMSLALYNDFVRLLQ